MDQTFRPLLDALKQIGIEGSTNGTEAFFSKIAALIN